MKFAVKLTVLLLVFVVLFGTIISYFVYVSNLKTLEKEITGRLEDDAYHAIDNIDRNLYERYGDIMIIASDAVISSRDSTPKQVAERLIEYRNAYKTYISLSFFDLNRIRIADTSGMHLGEQHEVVQWWIDSMDNGGISAGSDIRIAEELKIPIIYFADSVKDENGETFGVVVARMPVSKIEEMTSHTIGLNIEEGLEVDLVDKNGLLIYSNHNKNGILKDNLADWEAVKRSMEGEESGSLIGFDELEEDIFIFVHEKGYFDFKGNDWTLLIHIPTRIAFAPAVQLRNRVMIILLPLMTLAIFTAFLFSRTVTHSITNLKDTYDKHSK